MGWDSRELDMNQTVEGVVIGWVDENNPIVKTDEGEEFYFDIGGFDAFTKGGRPTSCLEESFKKGDRLLVTRINTIRFLKRGRGQGYGEDT